MHVDKKYVTFGVRLDFHGGMSVSKSMLRSAAFQKFVNAVKSAGLDIKMTLPQVPGGVSSVFFGVPAPIADDQGLPMPEKMRLPDDYTENLSTLKQFLLEASITVVHEDSGWVGPADLVASSSC